MRPPKLTSLTRLRLSAAATDHPRPSWMFTNHLYHKHPRLHSLEHCKSPHHLNPLLAYSLVSGLFRNPFVASRLLLTATTTTTSPLTFSTLLFSQITHPNIFSYNTLIRALAASNPLTALSLYVEMLHRGTRPDNFTLPFLLTSNLDIRSGQRVHTHAVRLGFTSDPFVHTALVTMYLNSGSTRDAMSIFDEMQDKDVVSWTSMISGLVEVGCHGNALEVFTAMRSDSNVRPNMATVVSTMSACAGLGTLDNAYIFHGYLHKVVPEGEIVAWNSLVDLYAKCGSIRCAVRVFDSMRERDLHSWTAMIMGMALHGLGKEAIGLFSRMEEVGVRPDSITFIAVLSACSHGGLMDEGIRIFESMERVYGIAPEEKHCGCMVDLFGRAGLLARAYEFIMKMPTEANLHMWGALLSACRVCGDLKLGELVAKKIGSLSRSGGVPVLMSNMYADQNRWDEVVSIRKLTRGVVGKPPGRSSIDLKGVVHEFIVGDRSHPHDQETLLVLNGLQKLMEGYSLHEQS